MVFLLAIIISSFLFYAHSDSCLFHYFTLFNLYFSMKLLFSFGNWLTCFFSSFTLLPFSLNSSLLVKYKNGFNGNERRKKIDDNQDNKIYETQYHQLIILYQLIFSLLPPFSSPTLPSKILFRFDN